MFVLYSQKREPHMKMSVFKNAHEGSGQETGIDAHKIPVLKLEKTKIPVSAGYLYAWMSCCLVCFPSSRHVVMVPIPLHLRSIES